MKEIHVALNGREQVPFHNHTSYCVGTGRLDLGLHEEYQRQLARAQELCHFSHIRGHGLFSDQMGIYQERENKDGTTDVSYCFTYADRVFDMYRKNGIRPFLELGFMPRRLASGTQTIFYWNAQVTPPRDMEAWIKLVRATLTHFRDRYGEDEVSLWPCEIWNEPNHKGFWENADKEKYFDLYRATVLCVKEVLPRMRVGGPAICGGTGSQDWIRDFLAFCRREKLPVDFVTRHAYMGLAPEYRKRYVYHPMCDVSWTIDEMRESRGIIDSFPEYEGLPMYITEFNTSYNPFCPIHDTVLNAACCAGLLARLGDVSDGYSYWTFGDVFEEQGIPPRPFHGGFGLLAEGQIEKPTAWAFSFFADLKGDAVYRDDNLLVTRTEEGGYDLIAWNICPDQPETLHFTLELPAAEGPWVLVTDRVDGQHGNPVKGWHDLGEPASLTEGQRALLKAMARPWTVTETLTSENGVLLIKEEMTDNAVLRLRLRPVRPVTEEGYDYRYYRPTEE